MSNDLLQKIELFHSHSKHRDRTINLILTLTIEIFIGYILFWVLIIIHEYENVREKLNMSYLTNINLNQIETTNKINIS